jgi:hypothetical protein
MELHPRQEAAGGAIQMCSHTVTNTLVYWYQVNSRGFQSYACGRNPWHHRVKTLKQYETAVSIHKIRQLYRFHMTAKQ